MQLAGLLPLAGADTRARMRLAFKLRQGAQRPQAILLPPTFTRVPQGPCFPPLCQLTPPTTDDCDC